MKIRILSVYIFALICLSGCLANHVGYYYGIPLLENTRLFSFDRQSYVQMINPDELPNVIGVYDRETDEEIWRWDLHIPDNDLKAAAWSDDNQHIAFVYHWSDYSRVYLCKIGEEAVVGNFSIRKWYHDLFYSQLRNRFILGEHSIFNALFGIPVRFFEP